MAETILQAVLRQQLVHGDREIVAADAGGVEDGVADGGGRADRAQLSQPAGAEGPDVGVRPAERMHGVNRGPSVLGWGDHHSWSDGQARIPASWARCRFGRCGAGDAVPW